MLVGQQNARACVTEKIISFIRLISVTSPKHGILDMGNIQVFKEM